MLALFQTPIKKLGTEIQVFISIKHTLLYVQPLVRAFYPAALNLTDINTMDCSFSTISPVKVIIRRYYKFSLYKWSG